MEQEQRFRPIRFGDGDITWKQVEYYPLSEALEYDKIEFIDWNKLFSKKLLDYGSGGGRDAFYFLIAGASVDCADILQENLDLIKKRLGEILCLKTNFFNISDNNANIPVRENYYDIINANGVLHHIEKDINLVVDELYRVLKPNGICYCMLYTEELYNNHKKEIEKVMIEKNVGMNKALGWITDKCPYTTYYTEEEGKELFKKFKILSYKTFHDDWFRIYKLTKEEIK